MPSHGVAPSMAGAHARKGAGEVTPKGLYFREGRVDERSEIYPVWMSPHAKSYPLGGCTFLNSLRKAIIDAHARGCVNHDDAMPRMVTCGAFDSTQKESTTPKGVASLTPCSPG